MDSADFPPARSRHHNPRREEGRLVFSLDQKNLKSAEDIQKLHGIVLSLALSGG